MISKTFEKHISALTNFSEYKKSINTYPRKSIRVNTIKITKENLLKRIKNLEPIPWIKEGFFTKQQLGNSVEHTLGYFFIQEAAAMIPALVLNPEETDKVLDLCAAPGGKTTQLASLMKNKGLIIANDINNKRLDILKQNLQRLGILNTATTFNYKPQKDFFTKVLVDAPCSGTGKINLKTTKGKRILKQWNPKTTKFSKLQKQLILKGFDSLKPNGTLVYSTCSIEPEENEEVIKYLLKNRNAKLEKIEIKSLERKKFLRLFPQDNQTEGFFVAKITKTI